MILICAIISHVYWLCSSQTPTVNMIALPKTAFRTPPTHGPNLVDSLATVDASSLASGGIAKILKANTTLGFHASAPAMMPRGTKMKSMLM